MEESDDDSLIMAGMLSDGSDVGSEEYFEFNDDLSSDAVMNVDNMEELCM
jgi:hypothetical protein